MFCYNKGIEKAGTEFWSEHGYFMGRQWLKQLCDLLNVCNHLQASYQQSTQACAYDFI